MDARRVKNTDTAGHKGYDAGKVVIRIKRHIAVDPQGLPRDIEVTRAGVRDRKGAQLRFVLNANTLTEVRNVLVNGGYTGEAFEQGVRQILRATVEVARRTALHKFPVIPKC